MITNLKLNILSRSVMVTLLPTLGRFHPLLDEPNLICGLPNHFRSKGKILSKVYLTQRSSIPPTIQCLVWCHTNRGVKTIIIGELY